MPPDNGHWTEGEMVGGGGGNFNVFGKTLVRNEATLSKMYK